MLSSKPEFRCLRAAGRDPRKVKAKAPHPQARQAVFTNGKELSGNCIPVRGPCSLVLGHAYWLAYCAKPPVALPSTTVNWRLRSPPPHQVFVLTPSQHLGLSCPRTAAVSNLMPAWPWAGRPCDEACWNEACRRLRGRKAIPKPSHDRPASRQPAASRHGWFLAGFIIVSSVVVGPVVVVRCPWAARHAHHARQHVLVVPR
jgi:hypothetical protein